MLLPNIKMPSIFPSVIIYVLIYQLDCAKDYPLTNQNADQRTNQWLVRCVNGNSRKRQTIPNILVMRGSKIHIGPEDGNKYSKVRN